MKLTKPLLTLFITLTILVNYIIIFVYFTGNKTNNLYMGINLVSLTGDITVDSPVISKFIGNGEIPVSLDVFFSTYNRVNHGRIYAKISDDKNELYTCSLDIGSLNDNQFYSWKLNGNLPLSKGKEYTLELYSDAENKSITAWKDENGNLVSKIQTSRKLPLIKVVMINVFYAILNYGFCLLLYVLKRKS